MTNDDDDGGGGGGAGARQGLFVRERASRHESEPERERVLSYEFRQRLPHGRATSVHEWPPSLPVPGLLLLLLLASALSVNRKVAAGSNFAVAFIDVGSSASSQVLVSEKSNKTQMTRKSITM